jgi:hypothetical protein
MQKQIIYTRWYEIDGNEGITFVPQDVVHSPGHYTMSPSKEDVQDYYSGTRIDSIRVVDGYGARLSMPGYLDCTEWSVFSTKEQAAEYLDEAYGE